MIHRPVPFELPALLLAWLEAVAEEEAGQPEARGKRETVEYIDGEPRRFGDLTGEEMRSLVDAYRNRSAALELYAEWLEDFVEATWGEGDKDRGAWSLEPSPDPPSLN